LRHVPGDQVSSPHEFSGIRLENSSRDLEKRRLPGTVAANQPDTLSIEDGKG
jgi:hypothetical protein